MSGPLPVVLTAIAKELVSLFQTITVANGFNTDVVYVRRALTPDWRSRKLPAIWITAQRTQDFVPGMVGQSMARAQWDVVAITERPGSAVDATDKVQALLDDIVQIVFANRVLPTITDAAVRSRFGGHIYPISTDASRELSDRTGRAAGLVTLEAPYRPTVL